MLSSASPSPTVLPEVKARPPWHAILFDQKYAPVIDRKDHCADRAGPGSIFPAIIDPRFQKTASPNSLQSMRSYLDKPVRQFIELLRSGGK